MVDDIKLNGIPKQAGVYKIIWFGAVIYVGSSNDLYRRMTDHKFCIKQGSRYGHKKGFYLFLQNNPFTVEFELTENYLQKEQELIDYFEPIYNERVPFVSPLQGQEYLKQYLSYYYENHKGVMKQQHKQYREVHKEDRKQYDNQKCNYNGEILTLCALKNRFQKQGIKHPTLEAKKYLIS